MLGGLAEEQCHPGPQHHAPESTLQGTPSRRDVAQPLPAAAAGLSWAQHCPQGLRSGSSRPCPGSQVATPHFMSMSVSSHQRGLS